MWRIHREVKSTKLKRIDDEIYNIKELDISLLFVTCSLFYSMIPWFKSWTSNCGSVLKYFLEKHQELDTISLVLHPGSITCNILEKNEIVRSVFSHENIRSILSILRLMMMVCGIQKIFPCMKNKFLKRECPIHNGTLKPFSEQKCWSYFLHFH